MDLETITQREVIRRNDSVFLMPRHWVLPASLAAECSVWGRQTVLRCSNQTHPTRLGQERPQRMAWCDCEAGAIGNCLEAPASHQAAGNIGWANGIKAHGQRVQRRGGTETGRETGGQKSPGAVLVLGPVQTPEVSVSDRTALSSKPRWSPHPAQKPSPVLSPCHPCLAWIQKPRSTLPADIKFSECKVCAVKPALSCFQGYLCNKLCKV